MKYYLATVSVEFEDAKGKTKKKKEQYLVDSLSVTEAEAKIVNYFRTIGMQLEYEVVKVAETNIIKVL